MKFLRLFVLAGLCGCAVMQHNPPLSTDAELEAYRVASAWPDADAGVLVNTAVLFANSGRAQEGWHHFHDLATRFPQRALLTALDGMLQIQMASDVPLLKRVAWVEEGLAKLDAAVAQEPIPEKLLRGLVEAQLPARFNRANNAVIDLQAALDDASHLPFEAERGIYHALAKAWTVLGDSTHAQTALAAAGVADINAPQINNNQSVNAVDGYRFGRPRTVSIGPREWLFQGYDFGNVYARETDLGVILIDTGTTEASAKAILAALRSVCQAPIHTIILTHSHWDHIGGLAVFRGENTHVIANSAFATEVAQVNDSPRDFAWFFGQKMAEAPLLVQPDHLVNAAEDFHLGDVSWQLIPVASGETNDALIIYDPNTRIAIVGDVLMPFLGAPFVNEGSPDGVLRVIATLRALNPAKLLHGHDPLTRLFTVEALPGLADAIQQTVTAERELLKQGHTPAQLLRELPVPVSLQSTPKAALPYLVMRDGLIQRTARQGMGYWTKDLESVDPSTPDELAVAIDLVGGGSPRAFVHAAEALVERGDFALAVRIATLGILRYPENSRLQQAKRLGLAHLREKSQNNPFKFIVYSEALGTELSPVGIR